MFEEHILTLPVPKTTTYMAFADFLIMSLMFQL